MLDLCCELAEQVEVANKRDSLKYAQSDRDSRRNGVKNMRIDTSMHDDIPVCLDMKVITKEAEAKYPLPLSTPKQTRNSFRRLVSPMSILDVFFSADKYDNTHEDSEVDDTCISHEYTLSPTSSSRAFNKRNKIGEGENEEEEYLDVFPFSSM
jgi:hypothetical protein